MKSRVEEADALHRKGYNCAQSIACTYCDLFDTDTETMFRAAEGLGLGMGGMEGTCGAISGACLIAGLATSTGDLEHPNSKAKTYAVSRELVQRFKDEVGAVHCAAIKGHEDGVMRMPCTGCVTLAAQILEEVVLRDMIE